MKLPRPTALQSAFNVSTAEVYYQKPRSVETGGTDEISPSMQATATYFDLLPTEINSVISNYVLEDCRRKVNALWTEKYDRVSRSKLKTGFRDKCAAIRACVQSAQFLDQQTLTRALAILAECDDLAAASKAARLYRTGAIDHATYVATKEGLIAI